MSKMSYNGYILRMFGQIFVFFGLFTAGQELHSVGLTIAAVAYSVYTIGNVIMEYGDSKEQNEIPQTEEG